MGLGEHPKGRMAPPSSALTFQVLLLQQEQQQDAGGAQQQPHPGQRPAGAQVCGVVGGGQRPPRGPGAPPRSPALPLTHICAWDRPTARPRCCYQGARAAGTRTCHSPPCPCPPGRCVPAARTDLQALPRRHVLLQLLLQQPRAAGSLRGEGVVGCVAVVTPRWGPGDAYRGGEAGEGRAAAPLQGAERCVPPWCHQQEVIPAAGQRSWGQDAAGGRRGTAPGPDPAPGAASAPPACVQQYSRSCRHCFRRTCPPLLTCRRERVGEAAHGAAAG